MASTPPPPPSPFPLRHPPQLPPQPHEDNQHSPLLSLPLELRQTIYHLLTPRPYSRPSPICYPFAASTPATAIVTSMSHTPPPHPLILTCRQLHAEVLAYHYGHTTLRFAALGSAAGAVEGMCEGEVAMVRRARRVELMLVWNLTKARAEARSAGGKGATPYWMEGWVEERVKLLREVAGGLRVVVVSLRDASSWGVWEEKRGFLEPLRGLVGRGVRFEVGEVVVVREAEGDVRSALGAFLEELNEAPGMGGWEGLRLVR